MAIEKGLYQAPNGLDMDDTAECAALEIDIVNPDMVTLDDGSLEVTLTRMYQILFLSMVTLQIF